MKVKIGLLVMGVCLMAIGITNGEVGVVFNKAIKICLECIGIG